MCEAIIAMLIAAVIVGVVAQTWKKRTGAFWAIATFVLELPAYFLLYFVAAWNSPNLYDPVKHPNSPWAPWLALALLVIGGIGGTMLLIVATLPKSKKDR